MHARATLLGYTQVFTFPLLLGYINNTFFPSSRSRSLGWWKNSLEGSWSTIFYEEKRVTMCEFTQRLLNRPTSVCFSLIAQTGSFLGGIFRQLKKTKQFTAVELKKMNFILFSKYYHYAKFSLLNYCWGHRPIHYSLR